MKNLTQSHLKGAFVIKDIEKYKEQNPVKKNQISVDEMQKLMVKIEEFYEKRPCQIDLFELARLILLRLKSDRDFFLSIEGIKGTGKSNFMVLLILVMCRYAGIWYDKQEEKFIKVLPRSNPLPEERYEHIECSVSFDNNLSFLDDALTLQTKFNSIERFMPFGIDEGSKNLHKQKWQDAMQFKLVQMSDTERWQNKAFFVCFPNFKELNTVFRNDRIQMRIYAYVRYTKENYAKAILSVKDNSRWTSDPWHLQENEKLFENILKKIPMAYRTPEHIAKAERRLKGYAGELNIPSLKTLAPRIWDIYYKYKIDNAKKEMDNGNGKDSESIRSQKQKYAIKKLISFVKLKFPNVKFTEIAKLTNMSSSAISKLYNEKLDIEDKILKERKLKKEVEGMD